MFLVRASVRFSQLAVPSLLKQERQPFVFVPFFFSVNIVDNGTVWCFVGSCSSCFFPDASFLTHDCAYRTWISSLREGPPYVSMNCSASTNGRYNFHALWSSCIVCYVLLLPAKVYVHICSYYDTIFADPIISIVPQFHTHPCGHKHHRGHSHHHGRFDFNDHGRHALVFDYFYNSAASLRDQKGFNWNWREYIQFNWPASRVSDDAFKFQLDLFICWLWPSPSRGRWR